MYTTLLEFTVSPGGSREEQAMKTVRFRQRQMSVGKDGRTVLPLAKKS
jgi:hypothetical protein